MTTSQLLEAHQADVPFQIADALVAIKGGQRLAYFGRISLDMTKNRPLVPIIFREIIDCGKGVNKEKKYKIQQVSLG